MNTLYMPTESDSKLRRLIRELVMKNPTGGGAAIADSEIDKLIANYIGSALDKVNKSTVCIKKARRLISDYMSSEGCSCCRGGDHDEHKEAIAKLLKVPKYKDKSGYNFYKYKTKKN